MLRNYYYQRLNTTERALYDTLLVSFKRRKSSTYVDCVPSSAVIQAIRFEHPELINMDICRFEYICDDTNVEVRNNTSLDSHVEMKIDSSLRNIANSINGDEEKIVRLVHNFFVKNVKYDYRSTISKVYDYTSHSVIGPLAYGRGVCDGISLAFKRILDIKGIDNTVVVGTLLENGIVPRTANHMWNVVSVNGNNYFIDVTQDIGFTEERWKKPSYMYYMLTEKELRHTHSWTDDFDCRSVTDNPFDKYHRNFISTGQIKNYVSGIPQSERLIYFKSVNLPENEISKAVMETLSSTLKRGESLSLVQNAGRYYFYKEG